MGQVSGVIDWAIQCEENLLKYQYCKQIIDDRNNHQIFNSNHSRNELKLNKIYEWKHS